MSAAELAQHRLKQETDRAEHLVALVIGTASLGALSM
jgi:hypothetical protein